MGSLLNRLGADRVIWLTAFFLGLISLLAVYSSIASLAYKSDAGTFRFLFKHLLMLASGGAIMYVASKPRFTVYSRLSKLLIGFTAVLLLGTLLLGANLNSASRWMMIPGLGVTFQTSDLAKVVLLVYVARVIAKRDEPWTMRDVMLKLMLPVGGICALILPANFSTAALLFGCCTLVMFIGRVPVKHMALFGGIAAGSFGVLLLLAKTSPGLLPRLDTWVARIENFTSDDVDSDANYQVEHAKIAIASGGLLPNGPGTGASRNYLPHPYSDMIYAFIVEEYGSIIGGLGMLLLYLILMFRAIRIANRCEKPFGSLVAIGLGLSLVVQALVNMAVAVNLVPVTGQPLPLVSMGGTSIWFTCLSIGIILSVSRSVYDTDVPQKAVKRQRTTSVDDGPEPALA